MKYSICATVAFSIIALSMTIACAPIRQQKYPFPIRDSSACRYIPPKLIETDRIPIYPLQAFEEKRKSQVEVEVTVDEFGSVSEIVITKSGGQDFDYAVSSSLKDLKFSPCYRDCKPTSFKFKKKFNFVP